jgi:hypothetical protein
MGKKGDKGEEEATVAPVSAKIQALKTHIQRVEEMVQNQSLQLKTELQYEMSSSHVKLQAEIKDNLEDFLTRFMRLQSGMPPPQGPTADPAASNMGQLSDHQSAVGENSPCLQFFLYLILLLYNLQSMVNQHFTNPHLHPYPNRQHPQDHNNHHHILHHNLIIHLMTYQPPYGLCQLW